MTLKTSLQKLLSRFITLLRWLWSCRPWLSKDAGTEPADFYHARPGQILHSKYAVQCKLGGGAYSTTYLASCKNNSEKQQYVAVKILSRDATGECKGDKKTILELDIMRKIRDSGEFDNLPRFIDSFEILEQGTPAHICMVMHVLGSDVGSFRRSSPNKNLPHYTVRIIIKQIVDALVHLHGIGIVHTDVKPDNMLFHTWMSAAEIEDWLMHSVPPSVTDGQNVSYPLPNSSELTWDCPFEVAKRMKVALVDLGQAQWANKSPTVDQFSAFSLRAPEVILQSDFTTAIDIWAIGCIVFEMLVGRWLFHPVDGGDDWTLEDDHLAKMMEFTGERFSERMRSHAHKASQYFDDQGNLLRVTDMFPVTVESALANYKILPSEEIKPAADFICACIRLEPRDRPTAREVSKHPWLQMTGSD